MGTVFTTAFKLKVLIAHLMSVLTTQFSFTACQSHPWLSKHKGLSRPSYWCSWLHPVCRYSARRHFLSVQAVAPERLLIDWEPKRSFIDIQRIKHARKAFLHLLQEFVLCADRKDTSLHLGKRGESYTFRVSRYCHPILKQVVSGYKLMLKNSFLDVNKVLSCLSRPSHLHFSKWTFSFQLKLLKKKQYPQC